jgi:RHS repeat-associated protein
MIPIAAAYAAFLCASTALTSPALAQSAPAQKFVQVDENGVDLTTGEAFWSMVEGSIGSGPGALEMIRYWAGPAGWADNWTGSVYTVTQGGVATTFVQLGPIADTFTCSAGTCTSTKANGATLDANGYTSADGTQISFTGAGPDLGYPITGQYPCDIADPGTCGIPTSMKLPSGMTFTLGWNILERCLQFDAELNCIAPKAYFRLGSVTSSANYRLTINYATDTPGTSGAPVPDWFKRTNLQFTNLASPPSSLPTVTYANPSGTETDVTDAGGRTWKLTNGFAGNLTGVRQPGAAADTTSIAYDSTTGLVSSVTKEGVTKTYAHSVAGTTGTMTVTDPLSHSKTIVSDLTIGRPTSITDELGHQASYAYDANGRLTKATRPEGNFTQYAYDSRGNVTTTTSVAKAGSGLANIVASASYDATCANLVKCNEPNSTTDPKGNVTNYVYDPTHGGVTSITRPAPATGAVRPQTRYSYTQVTAVTGQPVFMLTGISQCQTTASCTGAADEAKTAVAYNTSNLLPTSVTRENGTGTLAATDAFTYDPIGNLLTLDGPLAGTGDTTAFKYDVARERTGLISPDPDGTGALPNRAIRLTYRPDGQVSKEELGTTAGQTDAAFSAMAAQQTVDVTFDANSRPVTRKLSSGATAYALTQTDYDSLGRVNCQATRMNSAVYASLPASACTLSSQGSFGPDPIVETVYDAAGEVTQVQEGVGTADAANERTLTYSNNGRLKTLKDGENNLTTYVYDGFDRLSQTKYPSPTKGAGTSSTTDFEQLTYDANSNVTARRLRDGTSIAFTYDMLNRLTLKTLPGGEPDCSYAYDNLGRLTSAGITGNNLTFTYDALNRNLTEVGPQGTVTSAYDLAGRRTSIAYPVATGATNLTVAYTYLTTGEVSTILDGTTSLATYAYDDLGNRTSATLGNGVATTYAYDPVSRLTTLTHNLAGTTNDLTIGGSTTPITYSPASQILSAPRSNNVYSWTGAASVNRNYTANGLNQYTAAGPASFTYDAKGNLTADGTNAFCYSSENLLTGENGTCAAPTVALSYDPFLRLSQVAGTTTTKFAYDGVNLIADYNGANALQHRYVFGPGMDEPIVEYSSTGARTWLSSDERGSIVARTDSTGALSNANTYDEYGIPGSANAGLFQYTGQVYLPQLGMYYYKARIYSPTLGRFVQTDPIGPADNVNLYAYVHNDPVNFADPMGLTNWGAVVGGGLRGALEGGTIGATTGAVVGLFGGPGGVVGGAAAGAAGGSLGGLIWGAWDNYAQQNNLYGAGTTNGGAGSSGGGGGGSTNPIPPPDDSDDNGKKKTPGVENQGSN